MPLTEKQVAERVNYLGASDCAAVLGLSRYKTPLEVWAEKTGLVPPEDISDRLPIEIGNELEEVVCKLFTKRTGKTVHRVNETIYHPNYPFIAVNLDRRVVGEDAVLEAKTCGAWAAREWEGEDVPQEYILQVLHQLAVTGKARGYIAVLIGGNQQFVWKCVERDPVLIAEIMRKETEFWTRYVEPKVMPRLVTKNDADVLFKLFPNAPDGTEIQLGDDALRIIESLQALNTDHKNLEGIIDKERNELKQMLGDNQIGLVGGYKVSWKNQVTRRFDIEKLQIENPEIYSRLKKETPSRVLRVSKIKAQEKQK